MSSGNPKSGPPPIGDFSRYNLKAAKRNQRKKLTNSVALFLILVRAHFVPISYAVTLLYLYFQSTFANKNLRRTNNPSSPWCGWHKARGSFKDQPKMALVWSKKRACVKGKSRQISIFHLKFVKAYFVPISYAITLLYLYFQSTFANENLRRIHLHGVAEKGQVEWKPRGSFKDQPKMALVWSINERASHGCPRISESQNNQKPVVPSPPLF